MPFNWDDRKVGNRKSNLRASVTGKFIYGIYITGTPNNSNLACQASPHSSSSLSDISCALICHAGFSEGHVVNVAPCSKTCWGDKYKRSALPWAPDCAN